MRICGDFQAFSSYKTLMRPHQSFVNGTSRAWTDQGIPKLRILRLGHPARRGPEWRHSEDCFRSIYFRAARKSYRRSFTAVSTASATAPWLVAPFLQAPGFPSNRLPWIGIQGRRCSFMKACERRSEWTERVISYHFRGQVLRADVTNCHPWPRFKIR